MTPASITIGRSPISMPKSTEALDRLLNLRGRIARDGWVAAAKKLTEAEGQAA